MRSQYPLDTGPTETHPAGGGGRKYFGNGAQVWEAIDRKDDLRVGYTNMMVDGVLVAVTAFSLVLAAAMAVMTWRVFRQLRSQPAAPAARATAPERRPSLPARTAPERAPGVARASAGFPTGQAEAAEPAWARTPLRRTAELQPMPAQRAAQAVGSTPERSVRVWPGSEDPGLHLGRRVAAGSQTSRRLLTAAGVCAALILFALGASWSIASSRREALATSPAAAQVASPLELVALDYKRDGAQASIRGQVRNPEGGSRVQQLEAVIILFDRRGAYVGTTHAPVADGTLAPGTERAFEVPLAAGLDVSQYRVSFRIATAPVPYVDRRPVPVAPPPAPRGDVRGNERAPQSRSTSLIS